MESQNEDNSNYVPIIEDLGDVESFILKVYKSFPFVYKNATNQYLGNIYLFIYSHVAYRFISVSNTLQMDVASARFNFHSIL